MRRCDPKKDMRWQGCKGGQTVLVGFAGPSLAFEKWYGHGTPKAFRKCRRHKWGESTRGGEEFPPSRKGDSGNLPRENFWIQDASRSDSNAFWDHFCLRNPINFMSICCISNTYLFFFFFFLVFIFLFFFFFFFRFFFFFCSFSDINFFSLDFSGQRSIVEI